MCRPVTRVILVVKECGKVFRESEKWPKAMDWSDLFSRFYLCDTDTRHSSH